MTNTRRMAAFAVLKWLETKSFAADVLPQGPERAFVQDIVYTVMRRLRTLRYVLGLFVKKWPKGELEALLYVGAAQILFMEGVPDFAAVHETVEAAKHAPNPNVAKVVNGVLRSIIRSRERIEKELAQAPVEVRESFPTLIIRRWQKRFGSERAEALARWHNQPAETFLARPDGTFVALERGRKVTEVPGYDDGAFIVQDPGTALAVSLMEVQAGDRILDACAAPGGKTIQLLWRGARVTACEINPRRRERLVANLSRAKCDIPIIDALPAPSPSTLFQKILVDAPCSNTGVLRRRPDARWNWSEAKLDELVRLQAEILDRAAALLEPNGRLVYATCSNEPEENALQVEAFLKRHPDFACERSEENVPDVCGTDGAFAAALVRKTI